MTIHTPLPRRGRKADQILAGARDVFLRDGFEGASVDDIARAAQVSKATLYSNFGDKRKLFQAVVTAECDRMSMEILAKIDPGASLREALKTAALGMAGFLVSRFAQRVFRICLAERDRFPELGLAYFESGPRHGHYQITEQLRCACEAGELEISDIDMAAYQFTELCKANIFTRAAFGIQSEFSAAEIEQVAQEAVETFLARYGCQK